VGPVRFGDGSYPVIAGPCSVESAEQVFEAARIVAKAGAAMLRGGAFKPRTSPYSFQGLGVEGLRLLEEAGRRSGLPTVTEVLEPDQVDLVAGHVDMLQLGARSMQNFPLLRAAGQSRKPVLLKRGPAATVEEWLLAAEYVLAEGNEDVVLCERGIRTFETATRNTLDISAVPVVKALTHLPVIIDPSHATGRRDLIAPLGLAGRAVGADGMMVEVHPDPSQALSDGPQQLDAAGFEDLMSHLGICAVRDDIDRIDREILGLVSRRLGYSVEIGLNKVAQGMPLHSSGREAELLGALISEAEERGLEPSCVREIFELILEYSRRAQRRAVVERRLADGMIVNG
jgi:3-deoxy-7-phosphoheptulonate synthase